MTSDSKPIGLEQKYLKLAGLMILYLLGYLIISKFTSYLYFNKMGNLMFAGKQLNTNIPLYHLFLDAFLLPFFVLVFAIFKHQNLFTAMNFGKVNLKTVGIIAILTFFTSLFTSAFMKMPWSETFFPNVSMLLNTRLLAQHPLQFIIWWPLHCAIWREMLFRGVIYNEFKSAMPVSMAVILQGLMQGFLFFLFTQFDLVFYGLLGSVIFALVYTWCNSLWASIIAQMMLEGFLFIWKSTNYAIFTDTFAPIILGFSMVLILFSLLYLKEYRESVNQITNSSNGKKVSNSKTSTVNA